jgi:hypothetical protein
MNKADEQLLARLQKETERKGLQFGDGTVAKTFDAVMESLVATPPLPKRQRRRRKRSK